MKKISIILVMLFISIVLILPVMAQGPTDAELAENTKEVALTILDVGLVNYLKGGISNIALFILAVIGLGNLIVRITPSKKDDVWYGKYILKPIRFIGKFISLQSLKDKENIENQ